MEYNELPNMPPREKIMELIDLYDEQTTDINKRREGRRETKSKIIAEMRKLKKGEISVVTNDIRYTFKIVPGDSNLMVTKTFHKEKEK